MLFYRLVFVYEREAPIKSQDIIGTWYFTTKYINILISFIKYNFGRNITTAWNTFNDKVFQIKGLWHYSTAQKLKQALGTALGY